MTSRSTVLSSTPTNTPTVRLVQYITARENPSEMNVFYRRWLFNAATEMAAANGDLESLQWLMESYLPDAFLTKAVSAAAANGHLGILLWLFEKHRDRGYWGYTEMCGSLTHGHSDVEWLREHAISRAECMVRVMDAAAGSGYVSVVKWLHEEYNVSMRSAISNAMDNQQWEISQWILEHRELVMLWISWDLPAKEGALGFLKFLYSYSIGRPGYFFVTLCVKQLRMAISMSLNVFMRMDVKAAMIPQ
ncbi:hypothetical protein V7S43_017917 [Phytophthora oleae]|uniref:Ankyrin repeat-containing domain n=1 Tax=Phytophthora oleae TaxID=2107226 RepID=A0ABD3ERZ9_9STRA